MLAACALLVLQIRRMGAHIRLPVLCAQEANVIRGALDLTSKQALVGMTPMEKVRVGACSSLPCALLCQALAAAARCVRRLAAGCPA